MDPSSSERDRTTSLGGLRLAATEQDFLAATSRAAGALSRFAAAMTAGDSPGIGAHPYLAELNVQMNGYYEGPK